VLSCRPEVVLLILLWAGVAGCSTLLRAEGPAVRVYWLTPIESDGPGTSAVPVTAVPGLETDQLLMLNDRQLVPFASARWAAPLPEVVGSVLGRSLDRLVGGHLPAAEVRRFFAVGAGPERPEYVDVALVAHACGVTRQLAARAPVREARLSAVVAAFQSAVDEVAVAFRRTYLEACREET
jgi:ABC-type uncharacterized transport system auxiliary subunit